MHIIKKLLNNSIYIFLLLIYVSIFFRKELYAENNEIYVEADSLFYNKTKNKVTAKGNALVRGRDIFILANEITYSKTTNNITAVGNVAIKEKDNIYFGDQVFLNIEHYSGDILNFKARLQNKGLLAASEGKLLDRDTAILKNMVFSTCKVCADNMVSYTPLWQIRAKTAKLDKKKERIAYKHVAIEAFGVPIFYTPYFSMPSPGAKQKTGFLMPKIKKSNIFGNQIQIPFYYNIAPNMDLKYSPSFSTKRSVFHNLKFRHLTQYGVYIFNGYFTKARKYNTTNQNKEKKILKGYIDLAGDFKINKNIAAGLSTKRTFNKDLNFAKEYDINKDDILNTNAYARISNEKNLIMLDNLFFQDLRPDANKNETPYVSPWFRSFSELPIKLPLDTRMFFSTDILNLKRTQGISYQRGSSYLESITNIILPYGQTFTFNPSVKWDLYHMKSNDTNHLKSYETILKKTKARTGYQIFMKWGLPLVKNITEGKMILEPLINCTINPNRTKQYIQPDGEDMEVSSENIFTKGYYSDKEIQELGTEITYGLRGNYSHKNGNYGLLLGQSYNFRKYNNKAPSSEKFFTNYKRSRSNFISKLYIQPISEVTIVDDINFSSKNMALYKNELDVLINLTKINLGIGYFYAGAEYLLQQNNIYNQELKSFIEYNFYDKWWINFDVRRKLGTKSEQKQNEKMKKWIENNIGLKYKGGCLNVSFGIKKDYIRGKNLKPSITNYIVIETI